MPNKSCGPGCAPAVIYSVLGGAGILLTVLDNPRMLVSGPGLVHLAMQILSVVFWTWVMYWLCSICYKGVAWFLLLFPLIVGLVLLYLVARHGKGLVGYY